MSRVFISPFGGTIGSSIPQYAPGIGVLHMLMVIGACTIELNLPGLNSLKEKRSALKSLIARLHKEFNVTAAEVDLHDVWQASTLGVATVSTSAVHAQRLLNNLVEWIEANRPDLEVVDHYVEVIQFSSSAGS